jgi:hypothetical protein
MIFAGSSRSSACNSAFGIGQLSEDIKNSPKNNIRRKIQAAAGGLLLPRTGTESPGDVPVRRVSAAKTPTHATGREDDGAS